MSFIEPIEGLNISIYEGPYRRGWNFEIYERERDEIKIATEAKNGRLTLEKYELSIDRKPLFCIYNHKTLQNLFDQLWAMGFRPQNTYEDLSKIIAGKDKHIEDLREIAFKTLKIERK